MAAQRKKPGPKPGSKRKPGRPPKRKTAAAGAGPSRTAKPDPVQDFFQAFKGFQPLTLIGMALGIAFLIFQLVPEWRFPWLPNFITAAGAAYIFWRQSRETAGLEEKVCKYGLLAVAILFLWRDYYISEQLSRVGELEWPFNN